ncbi:hypothetical protein [Herbidospora sp. RD11066]
MIPFVVALLLTPQPTVAMVAEPVRYVAGQKFTFTATVANPGTELLDAAEIKLAWPHAFRPLTWTCEASGGAICPATRGTGALHAITDLPGGGTLTYTLTCTMPERTSGTYAAVISVAAAGTSCSPDDPCEATTVAAPAI